MKNYCFFILILLFGSPVFAQFSVETDKNIILIEKELKRFDTQRTLQHIDSLLIQEKINPDKEVIIKALKVEALQQAELYEEALILSEKVLKIKDLPKVYRLRVFLQRAVIYEILDNLPQTYKEMQCASAVLKKNSLYEDKFYGQYLIRWSSYYRIMDQDSIAKDYAIKAKVFGEKNSFKGISAQSDMLMGFMEDRTKIESQIAYYKSALNTWKSFEDNHGTNAMYLALGLIHKKLAKPSIALVYLDSSIQASSKQKNYYMLAEGYRQKSAIYEKLNQPEKALFNFKNYQKYHEEYGIIKKSLAVEQLGFRSEIEKEEIKRDVVFKNLEKVKSYNIALIVLTSILLISFCSLAYLFYRISKKNRFILSQQERIKKSNKALKITVKEKQVLLKELHHRVKNNLSLILSMIAFQKAEIKNPQFKEKFETLNSRIKAVAIVHEQLLKREETITGKNHNIKEYIQQIANALIGISEKKIDCLTNIQNIYLSLDTAVPLGILINELISNSIKYAKPIGDTLIISITIKVLKEEMILEFSDNGQETNTKNLKNGLGLFIKDNMVSQLKATCMRKGWYYKISIPK